MWESFNQRHESRDSAFEALCCQLFERWCRREYEDSIQSFYFLDGRGGDGGVEAFAILTDNSVVGLQAKAWWDGFKKSQKSQIEDSLRSATTRHPTLVRYIVCCPLDLLESKGSGNTGKSQRERWQGFETEARTTHANVVLEYRGKTKIREWLQQPESETINAYWFDREVVPLDHWRQQFERVKSAAMDVRYVGDLHVATVLDENFSWFVNSSRSVEDLKLRISQLADLLEQKRQRISNLENLPGDHSPQALLDCATLVDAIDVSLANLRLLLTSAASQYLPAIEVDLSIDRKIREATSGLWKELGGRDRLTFASSPTKSVLDAVKGVEENLQAVRDLLETQQRLRRVLVVLGEAGMGKTQTITKLCDKASGEGVPILLLPARSFNPNNSWNEILSQATNRPGWTADQILDALEASCFFAWRVSLGASSAPRRAILALDGPDENSLPGAWNERLKELADLCKSRPLIAPIVTTRPESGVWLSMDDERFGLLHLQTPDVADFLPEILQEYVREYNITVPSPDGIAWALRTPFAIRVFAEVYRGQTIAPGQDLVTTLADLFKLKLQRLDDELHDRHPSWPKDRELSLRIFRLLLPVFVSEGHCKIEQFSEAVHGGLNSLGITIVNATAVFERSTKSYGLIDVYPIPTRPMMPDQIVVRPGFNALVDYLLASEVAEKIRKLSVGESIQLAPDDIYPPILRGRTNVCSLIVAMLLKDGISILGSEFWRDSVRQEELEIWHARAISDLRPEQASAHKPWVISLLRRDMASCRMLVAELFLPSSRVPGSTFGAEFLHQEFTQMSMTERDLVWSGPDWLPANCGGSWEGKGVSVHDSITLREDDSAISVPILTAWVTSSVIHERKRQAIARLSKWGSVRPAELAKLLLNFAAVDDVQVVESVFVAAAGAVLELVAHGAADGLAKVAHVTFFENRKEKGHPSVVARHAARMVIQRAFTIGTELPASILSSATPPYPPVGENLPIDAETVDLTQDGGRGAGFPLSSDLDWYVAENVRDPFFKQIRFRSDESEARRYADVPRQILDAAADGRLDVDAGVCSKITEEIELRARNQKRFSYFDIADVMSSVDTAEEAKPPQSQGDEENPLEQRPMEEVLQAFQSPSPSSSWPRFSPEAEAMLAEYARDVNASEPLNPRQLGNGLIAALIKKWGWNKETFYGDPRGQEPGETLGADIAILRQHSQARHGSRSSVAMFAEKYVWSAVNVVSTFFCDRLPGEDDQGAGLEMITNQSNLGSRMTDPLAGFQPDILSEFRPPWDPLGIAPTPDLTETRQTAKGVQWLEKAGWPEPADWFAASEDSAIHLSGFLAADDHAIGIQLAAWISCIAVPRALVHLIERDVSIAPDICATSLSVHEIKGHFGGGVYAPIRLAVWAPWVTDGESETWHTLSDSGEPVEIPLVPMVTETHWEGTKGETSAWSPSKLLRVSGGVIDCCGTDDALKFVGKERTEVAYYQRLRFPDDWSKSNKYLKIDRSKFFTALAEQDLVPVWGVRLYRELLPGLAPKGFVDQDSRWLVISKDGGENFRSILISREMQDTRDPSSVVKKGSC